MILELKHLSPYLPYELKCHAMGEIVDGTEHNDNPEPKTLTIVSLNAHDVSVMGILKTVDEQIAMSDCFPILHPLSDLIKMKEYNGKWFIPAKKLSGSMDGYWIIDYSKLLEKGEIEWWEMLLLFEWHFDVFGLIDKGLAIDINTLK